MRTTDKKVVLFDAAQRTSDEVEEFASVERMIEDGKHPAHAVYTCTINLTGIFSDEIVELPFLRDAEKFLLKALKLYDPGYPPLSPITVSFFNHWSYFDVRFGKDSETLGECFLAIMDNLDFGPVLSEALRELCRSRMGLYKVEGESGGTFRIRELVTGQEYNVIITSSFRPEAGCLALMRILPPLSAIPSPHIAVTTPYVAIATPEEDWLQYFERQKILPGAPGAEVRLHQHMKYGKNAWYWSEYFFYAYINHLSNAIFVTGLPDQPKTQPQHRSYTGGFH
ncbi:MAG: hypothetical protein KDN22_03450 [Verrucomicrobiae bacterium]|nr:hypothetical protein [Verrucomicrobiae bacterium]